MGDPSQDRDPYRKAVFFPLFLPEVSLAPGAFFPGSPPPFSTFAERAASAPLAESSCPLLGRESCRPPPPGMTGLSAGCPARRCGRPKGLCFSWGS